MKKCIFCAEEIQDEAIKCRHCGEFLEPKPTDAWYFKTSILVISILTIGPFALPLLWCNPHISHAKKIVLSIIICMISFFLMKATMQAVSSINEVYKEIPGLGF